MEDGFFEDHLINNGVTDSIAKTEYNAFATGNALKMYNLIQKRPVNPFNVKISDINTKNIN
jgi:hypothetical protein